jgi:NADPH-dependent glutamate synthase beta subunit-like oxidoreductase
MMIANKIKKRSNMTGKNNWVADEAKRCLSCFKPPCQGSCPASIPIPDFIRSLNSGNVANAARLIRNANPLASICGAVCPEEVFCQSHCTRSQIDAPIKIRELHSYVTGYETANESVSQLSKNKVAIIGSGPAGLSCAIILALQGVQAIIYERSDHIGGVPSSSIPDFRLNDETISTDIEYARKLGVEFKLNTDIDDPKALLKDHQAVFIAAGLAKGVTAKIPGSESTGVLSALSFLEKARSGNYYNIKNKRMIIIGGGNVSLDVAAVAMESGAAEVHLLYRRGPAEMKVWQTELDEAQKRGVVIDYLTMPIEYMAKTNQLQAVKCIRTRLTEKHDSSGRRMIEQVLGSEFSIPADFVVEAIGLTSDYSRDIKVNADLSTSVDSIFAGGDWARGEGTIVEAVRDGKNAAQKIILYMKDKRP